MDLQTVLPQTAKVPEFLVEEQAGKWVFNPHPGQIKAVFSPARFILILAGSQSGKTVAGVLWLYKEIFYCGPGDYMCVAPSYPLMQKKMLPEFLKLFQTNKRLGEYKSAERIFHFYKNGTKVFFGHADDPESLESATAKAAWLDEPGQNRFKLGSWEALQRRLAVHRGRAFLSTTPYTFGWLKQQVFDRWRAGDKDYDVINFDSLANPAFPKEEYERARRMLPRWKFDMFYRGIFTRPAGMIYDCFDDSIHKVPRVTIPSTWRRYIGIDFGGVNTAAVFLAEEPVTKKLFVYREYHPATDPTANPQRTAAEHTHWLLQGEPGLPYIAVGGAKSEGQWRLEFRNGGRVLLTTGKVVEVPGLPIREPAVHEVDVGIERVYGTFQRGELFVFDDLSGLLDEIGSYSREVDEVGQVVDEIADKESYHRLDALRYIVGYVKRPQAGGWKMERF